MADDASADGSAHRRAALARAALVALYATVGLPARLADDDTITWLPGPQPIFLRQALTRLAELPPSVQCVALRAGGYLHVAAWSGRDVPPMVEDILAWNRDAVARACPGVDAAGVRVLVTGNVVAGGNAADAGETAALTWAEYEEWMRTYHFPLATIQMGVAPASADGHPATLIVTVSPPAGSAAEDSMSDAAGGATRDATGETSG